MRKTLMVAGAAGVIALALATPAVTQTAHQHPATWTKCADEGGQCFTSNVQHIRYGTDTRWNEQLSWQGAIHCNNATFGDPAPGHAKRCETTGDIEPMPGGLTAAPVASPTPPPAPAPAPVGVVASSLKVSSQLDALAIQLMANKANNATLNTRLLTLIREPAKTLDGVTLPTTAAQYTANLETALKLRPAKWIYNIREHNGTIPLPLGELGGPAPMNCSVTLTDNTRPGYVPVDGEPWSMGVGNCPSVLSAAIAKAWASKLRRVGR